MKYLRHSLITLLAVSLLSTGAVFADGSVSFEERAIPLLRTQPALLLFVRQSLDVAPVGNAIRLGKQFGDRVGQRITPFSFEARPKGTGGPFTLLLIINSPEGIHKNDADAVTIEVRQLHDAASKHP